MCAAEAVIANCGQPGSRREGSFMRIRLQSLTGERQHGNDLRLQAAPCNWKTELQRSTYRLRFANTARSPSPASRATAGSGAGVALIETCSGVVPPTLQEFWGIWPSNR